VKIRSGWDQTSINAPEVARALEDAGAAAITVHPRCRSVRHRGTAAWPVIRAVKEAVSIPVIGNGDVRSLDSARAMVATTGVDGIMIGRGALTNPWVFRQISEGLSGVNPTEPTLADYRELFDGFLARLRELLPERLVLNRMKAFIGWVTKGLPGGAALRCNVYASKSISDLSGVFARYFASDSRARPVA
jgi:tRNA-dihydrouridine synthase B